MIQSEIEQSKHTPQATDEPYEEDTTHLDENDDIESEEELRELFPTQGALDLSRVTLLLNRQDAITLQYELESKLKRPVDISFNANRSRVISFRIVSGRFQFRLHYLFAFAPEEVIDALVACTKRDPNARPVIRTFINDNADRFREATLSQNSIPIQTKGVFYDLKTILEEIRSLAEELLPQEVVKNPKCGECNITWGRNARGKRSIIFGSYRRDHGLIRIHPALDQDWIPHFFVKFVIFHEYLHHLLPCEIKKGRRVSHSKQFRQFEALFPHYKAATQWESENWNRLLDK